MIKKARGNWLPALIFAVGLHIFIFSLVYLNTKDGTNKNATQQHNDSKGSSMSDSTTSGLIKPLEANNNSVKKPAISIPNGEPLLTLDNRSFTHQNSNKSRINHLDANNNKQADNYVDGYIGDYNDTLKKLNPHSIIANKFARVIFKSKLIPPKVGKTSHLSQTSVVANSLPSNITKNSADKHSNLSATSTAQIDKTTQTDKTTQNQTQNQAMPNSLNNKNILTTGNMESDDTLNTSQHNPALLARDVPNPTSSVIIDDEYNKVKTETEEINEKISTAINEIRLRNQKRIDEKRQQQAYAHALDNVAAKNNQDLTNSQLSDAQPPANKDSLNTPSNKPSQSLKLSNPLTDEATIE